MTADARGQLPFMRSPEGGSDQAIVNWSDMVSFFARFKPDEGWLSIGLVLAMTGTMAWSIADARWILGRDELTGFVIPLAVLATAWGYFSARLGIAPWMAHLLGAAIGAIVVIEFVGSTLPLPKGVEPSFFSLFQATASSVAQAYLDLTWRHQITTYQYGHFGLMVGIFVWATAQAASYDVFGYHRAVNGVVLLAVVLLANMALTVQDHFWALVLFSVASLWLLVRAHAADVRSSWLRHRIWRGGDIEANSARGGLGFASITICGALVLTMVASSAPLQSFWPGLGDNFGGFANWISTYLPSGGQSRFESGAQFGSTKKISLSFQGSNSLVMTIRMPQGPQDNSHWRIIAYDIFRSTGWDSSGGPSQSLAAEVGLTAGTLDQIDTTSIARTPVQYFVVVKDTSLKHLVVANEPQLATVPVTRIVAGTSQKNGDVVWYPTDATSYSVTAYMPSPGPNGLTEWRLRQAGSKYPEALLARYTQGADLVGAPGQSLLRSIETWAAGNGVALDATTGDFTNAFDAAKAIQDYLRDPANFTYTTNVTDVASRCAGQNFTTVDCFATYKRGFCEQYATTMTMLMRMEGYPARYVEGFLSGSLDRGSNTIQITGQQRHAWVEVYFPNYGWIPFDPTGGPINQPTLLAPGSSAAPTPSSLPSASASIPGGNQDVTARPRPGGGAGGTTPTDGGSGLLIPVGGGLVGGFVLVLLFIRRPRRPDSAQAVYRSVVRLASRLGYRPLATQTVYEYTDMLAKVVPAARGPLETVATAQVEVTYGRRELPMERLMALWSAQRTVRQALLRLVWRVPRLGRGRQSGKGNNSKGR
jgi:transglutaminase-like putative cysteine protease